MDAIIIILVSGPISAAPAACLFGAAFSAGVARARPTGTLGAAALQLCSNSGRACTGRKAEGPTDAVETCHVLQRVEKTGACKKCSASFYHYMRKRRTPTNNIDAIEY